MGLYIHMVGVNSDVIHAVFGSADAALLKRVCAYCDNDVLDALNSIIYQDKLPSQAVKSQATLASFFSKFISPKKHIQAHSYSYALIELCHLLGQSLPYEQEIKLGFETDWIDRVLREDFALNQSIEMLLMAKPNCHGFNIPAIDDFPVICKSNQAALRSLQALFVNISITAADINALQNSDDDMQKERGYAYAHIQGVLDNVGFCLENQLDLMVFCH